KGARNKLAGTVYVEVLEFLTEPAVFQASERTKLQALLLTLFREAPRDLARFFATIMPREWPIEPTSGNELSAEELVRRFEMLRSRALAAREQQSIEHVAN